MELSFVSFNFVEGGFWALCAVLCLVGKWRLALLPHRFWYTLSVFFVLFSASDFIEGYFLVDFLRPGGEWLLWWKVLCIAGFVGCLVWYSVIRYSKK